MKVKVLKGPIAIGFRYVRAGSIIDLDDPVARVFMKAGIVAPFVEEPPKTRRVYRRRDVVPEQTAVMAAEPNDE